MDSKFGLTAFCYASRMMNDAKSGLHKQTPTNLLNTLLNRFRAINTSKKIICDQIFLVTYDRQDKPDNLDETYTSDSLSQLLRLKKDNTVVDIVACKLQNYSNPYKDLKPFQICMGFPKQSNDKSLITIILYSN